MAYSARDEMLSIGNQLNYITTYSFDALSRTNTRQFANGDFTTYSLWTAIAAKPALSTPDSMGPRPSASTR